jgi:hypothetical protein
LLGVQIATESQRELRLGTSYTSEADLITVGIGLRSGLTPGNNESVVYVQRFLDGVEDEGTSAQTVSVSCENASVCTTPATVVIPAGASLVAIPITGVGTGSTTLQISAPDYAWNAQTIRVEVREAPLWMAAPPPRMPLGSTFDAEFGFYSLDYMQEFLAADTVFTFVSSDPGVVTVPASVVVPAGTPPSAYGPWPTVPLSARASGFATITVSAPGFTAASVQVSVNAPVEH